MIEYDHEPIRGLPGDLPPGEHIVWQGSPDWRRFARDALHVRWIVGYFAALAIIAALRGSLMGVAVSLAAGVAVGAMLVGFAMLVSRTTVYTLTNRRLVLRIGVALNKCINLPLGQIGDAGLRERADGSGDIALGLTGAHRLGYAMLWPHARPFRFARPEPMLRALVDAQTLATLLARSCANARVSTSPATAPLHQNLEPVLRESAA